MADAIVFWLARWVTETAVTAGVVAALVGFVWVLNKINRG